MTREEFRERWSARQGEFGRLGVLVDGERICREVLTDFESVIEAENGRILSVSEAAEASGYSPEQLRRLYRQGALPGERRGKRVSFRFADLPRKAGARRRQTSGPYDPVADARELMAKLMQPRHVGR